MAKNNLMKYRAHAKIFTNGEVDEDEFVVDLVARTYASMTKEIYQLIRDRIKDDIGEEAVTGFFWAVYARNESDVSKSAVYTGSSAKDYKTWGNTVDIHFDGEVYDRFKQLLSE